MEIKQKKLIQTCVEKQLLAISSIADLAKTDKYLELYSFYLSHDAFLAMQVLLV